MTTFRRGTAHLEAEVKSQKGGGESLRMAYLLPDEEKERICRSLLAEFGVTHIRPGGNGELIHACVLPFNTHTDQDRNPTASLNYLKLTYNCLGSCQAGGSILWLVEIVRDVTGTEARKWLETQSGLGDDEESLANLMRFFDALEVEEKHQEPPMPKMDPKVLEPWLKIHPYMTEVRGIPESTLMAFKVGYGEMRVKLGPNHYVNSHRIVIPHFWEGDLVGWQTRRLVKDGTPKYKNSPDFPKDRTIYNYDSTLEEVIVVESPMSVLSKAHLFHIEATFGATITDRQKRLMAAHDEVILFMDNDEAGYKATTRLAEYLNDYSMVWVADNPWDADPADLDDETFLRCIEEAVPYALWEPPQELVSFEKEGSYGLQEVRTG